MQNLEINYIPETQNLLNYVIITVHNLSLCIWVKPIKKKKKD